MKGIVRETENSFSITYTVRWSPYFELEKFHILKMLPSEGGIFQIFKKRNRLLHLVASDDAYYGGFRNTVLELLDDLSPRTFPYKQALNDETCFIRFASSSLHKDIRNVLSFLRGSEREDQREILVMEKDSQKISFAVREKMKLRSYKDSIF